MIRRTVTLSDGTRVPVTIGHLTAQPHRSWYPDQPHCCVCDRPARGLRRLYTCDARIKGKHGETCGRYVCGEHRTISRAGYRWRDLCPTHAPKEERYELAGPSPELSPDGPHLLCGGGR